METSQRSAAIKPSPTLSVSAKAAAMRAAGKDVISLAAGEPDFDTPEHVKEAATKAIQDGFTKYTPVDGIPALKSAIVNKLKSENQLDYKSDQVLVSVGCKHSFYNLAQALLNPGDEVIIPAPYWVSYPDMVALAGAKPVFVQAGISQNFKITPDQLDRAISSKARLLVLNGPSNPTGACYSKQELADLGEVLEQHPHVVVASDDIYEHILWWGEPFSNILNACPALAERAVILNGVSKAYAMTGWRIGYAAGPTKLIKAMSTLQSQSTSNPTSIAQVAAQAALEGDQGEVKEHCQIFKQRHDFLHRKLSELPGVNCAASQGTFYIFPDMSGLIARLEGITDDIELAESILERAKIAMVPGSAFGAPGHMRLSFATDMETLEDAVTRLQRAFGD